ncbi:MAG: hypothetical protein VYE73_04415 [Acidobacteriota bacterium]|nr:hypothetical protein [Acidobacteriota bacterium]
MSWFSAWRAVLSNAGRSSAEIQTFQLGALRRILAHAHSNVSAYRQLYAGLSPSAIEPRSLADLGRITTTDRAWYQRQPEADLLADSARRATLGAYCTTGSSGQPMTVLRTALESRLLEAFRLRAFFGYGGEDP